jgi:hypothetical protein
MLLALVAGGSVEAGAQKVERDLISREEIVKIAARSPGLLHAVRSLRSHMVDTIRGTNRGVRSMGADPPARTTDGTSSGIGTIRNTPTPTPVLYVDGRKIGHLTLMADILTAEVEEVRYLNPTRAGGELGLGHEGGAILVKMYRPPPPSP